MSLTTDQFAKALISAGLASVDEVKQLWAALPAGDRPKSGEAFATLLIQRERITDFQAETLLSGGNTPLVLGDYVLVGRIGSGGMGQVFQARHRHMKRMVAIKVLPPALTQDEAAIKRFQREVEAAAHLSHPNIVQAHDASVQRGVWYLVMEYVAGRDLASVSAAGPLPVDRAIDVIRQAAKGLAFAHSRGVVHRDIKPANLLLDNEDVVKILDMGLARFENQIAAKDGLTQSGVVMGTIDYMAPEQAFDTHTADARADMYSLGCTLFRLLTQRNLYDADTIIKKLTAHQSKPIPSLLAARKDAPPGLAKIFEKMVAKAPEDRFASMPELIAALDALEGKPSVTVKASGGSSGFGSDTAVKTPPKVEVAPTVSLQHPQQATDPVSERSIQVARLSPAEGKQKAGGRKTLATIGGLAAAAILAVAGWFAYPGFRGIEPAKIHIDPNGAAQVVSATPTDYALWFDGTQAHVAIPSLTYDGSHPLTIEARVRMEGEAPPDSRVIAGWHGLISLTTWKQLAFGIEYFDSTGQWSSSVFNINAAAKSRFHHIAVVYDGREIRLFVDGVAGEAKPLSKAQNLFLVPGVRTDHFAVGCTLPVSIEKNRAAENCFQGVIDELRISKVARYAADYSVEPRLEPDDKTLALYHFDEGRGDKLVDASGYKHDGTLVGAKWVNADGTPLTTDTAQGRHGWPADAPKPAIAPFTEVEAKQYQKAWADYLKLPVEWENSIGMNFLLIPPGEFTIGLTNEEAREIEASDSRFAQQALSSFPQHRVRITRPFYMGAHEVTQKAYERVVKQNPSFHRSPGREKDTSLHPVERISYIEAARFCNLLGRLEKLDPVYVVSGNDVFRAVGSGYELPSEAQWEFACRAGSATAWISGDSEDRLKTAALFGGNSKGMTQPVGCLLPNAFGLFDMIGNAGEWCDDWHEDFFAIAETVEDPYGPNSGQGRIVRGGEVNWPFALCRSRFRHSVDPVGVFNHLGCRISISAESVRSSLKLSGPPFPKFRARPVISPIDFTAERKAAE